MASTANSAAKRREINRTELRRYLSENNKIRQIIKNIEKLEDETQEIEQVMVTRINSAITHRLSLLKKYLPDEKSLEIKNEEGGTFKTDSKWVVEFVNADPEAK
mgnify:FL=1|tara:strand:+ start:3507 stop:3818 length:312 start_codon:yes stop_codon:yes gene_type:complete